MTPYTSSTRTPYPRWMRLALLLLVITLVSGCSAVRNHMYRTSGSVMQGLSKEHTTPYLLQQKDLGMSCAMSEATTPMMMSFGRVTDEPNQLGVMMNLSAAGCSVERAREYELAYDRLMRDRNTDEARDAQYNARRHYREATLRYHRSWQNLNAHYGSVGEQACPSEKLETEMDQFMYMSGLIAGLQAMNTQVRAAEQLGVPNNIGSRVARASDCLDDDRWWGVPGAMKAAVYAMLPSAAPEDAEPFKQLEAASEKGEAAGVRLANVFHAVAAENAEEQERVRRVIRQHAEAIDDRAAPGDWVMIDETATQQIRAISDRLWTRETGHRTPTGQLGRFWDDAEADSDDIDLNELM